ncbi:hypothetical protein BGW42_003429 [Actinomortierella wolfii]|nr:hypothetical protein BGW42_003429 [Actinomortierella wolfii]
MKFAKCLQDEIVPEWRKAYINYKQGKKLLKAIEKALDEEAQELVNGLGTTDLESVATLTTYGPSPSGDLKRQGSTSSAKRPPLKVVTVSPQVSSPAEISPTTPIMQHQQSLVRSYSSFNNIAPSAGEQERVLQQPGLTASNPSSTLVPTSDAKSGDSYQGLTPQSTTAHETSIEFKPQERPRLLRAGSQFGQAALSQGSQMLRSLSRRLTMVQPDLYALKPREITQKEEAAVTKLKVIKQQILVADEWKRRHDQKAKAEAEQGWYLNEWSKVRTGIDNLIRLDTPKTENIVLRPSHDIQAPAPPPTVTGVLPMGTLGKKGLLRRAPHNGPDGTHHTEHFSPDVDQEALQAHLIELERENRRQHLNHKVARTRIKAALYEYYRSLEMLKNYKVLNHTGFAKILKKFDKTAGWRAAKTYMNTKIEPSYFISSTILTDLIAETEEVFIDAFEKGHRRRGMAKLRIPDSKNQTHHNVMLRIGIYMGLVAPLMVQAVQSAFSEETEREIPIWNSLLLVYGGLFITILFACLFGINMYVWTKSRINYKFIFEFDPRDNLDFHEYFELPIFFMLLLTLAVYLDFGTKYTQHVATAYWPLIFMCIALFILFFPLPVFHFTSRRWFIASMGRILASGYFRVEFRDFFLADELNSLSYSIEQFEFAMCAYTHEWEDLGVQCQTSHMWITPFLTALPPWFRFLQCLRRYRDTLEWFPHLLNAGKYFTSLINLFVYFSYRHYGSLELKAMWILCSFLTSVYTFTWDVYMDWGLFQFGKHGGGAVGRPFLRQELVYPHTWVYYAAIVFDFVGRFSWVSRLFLKHIDVYILSFSLALLEMLRRWVWNFFRLENEHINNVGQFRAIKDIPLPFHIRVRGDSDEEDEEDYERNRRREDLNTAGSRPGSVVDDGDLAPPFAANADRRGSTFSSASGLPPRTTSLPISTFSEQVSRKPSSTYSQSQPIYGATGDQQGLFEVSRTSDYLDAAIAETGFHEADLSPATHDDVEARGKFYNRRDFDSRLVDIDDESGLGHRTRALARSLTTSPMSAGGGEGDAALSPPRIRRHRTSGLGARMRNTIFGHKKPSSDEEYETDEEAQM